MKRLNASISPTSKAFSSQIILPFSLPTYCWQEAKNLCESAPSLYVYRTFFSVHICSWGGITMFPILYSLTCIQFFFFFYPILMHLTLNKDRFNKSGALLFLWGKNYTLLKRSCLVKVIHFRKLLQRSAASHTLGVVITCTFPLQRPWNTWMTWVRQSKSLCVLAAPQSGSVTEAGDPTIWHQYALIAHIDRR